MIKWLGIRHLDHRNAILIAGIRSATELQLNQILTKLKTETEANERLLLIKAISCTSNNKWKKRLLKLTISKKSDYFKSNDERNLTFVTIAGDSSDGTKLAMDFMKENIEAVFSRFGSSNTNNCIKKLAHLTFNAEHTQQVQLQKIHNK